MFLQKGVFPIEKYLGSTEEYLRLIWFTKFGIQKYVQVGFWSRIRLRSLSKYVK